MPIEKGDYIKAGFTHRATGETEWMWVKVDYADQEKQVVFGTLDNKPLVNPDLHLGMELVVRFDNIREHRKPSAFRR